VSDICLSVSETYVKCVWEGLTVLSNSENSNLIGFNYICLSDVSDIFTWNIFKTIHWFWFVVAEARDRSTEWTCGEC
jgi:hypothetical protein